MTTKNDGGPAFPALTTHYSTGISHRYILAEEGKAYIGGKWWTVEELWDEYKRSTSVGFAIWMTSLIEGEKPKEPQSKV